MASALDTSGLTPLHYAAAADDAVTCRLLLRYGAPLLATSSAPCYDPQLPCNAGSTVLHVAAMHNAVKAADAILTEWVGVVEGRRDWTDAILTAVPYQHCHRRARCLPPRLAPPFSRST